jgi:hypothetical protein
MKSLRQTLPVTHVVSDVFQFELSISVHCAAVAGSLAVLINSELQSFTMSSRFFSCILVFLYSSVELGFIKLLSIYRSASVSVIASAVLSNNHPSTSVFRAYSREMTVCVGVFVCVASSANEGIKNYAGFSFVCSSKRHTGMKRRLITVLYSDFKVYNYIANKIGW